MIPEPTESHMEDIAGEAGSEGRLNVDQGEPTQSEQSIERQGLLVEESAAESHLRRIGYVDQ